MSEAAASPSQNQIYKVALANIIGSVIEQYDFLITGVIAATVWSGIFFKLPGLAAVAAAIRANCVQIESLPARTTLFRRMILSEKSFNFSGSCSSLYGLGIIVRRSVLISSAISAA